MVGAGNGIDSRRGVTITVGELNGVEACTGVDSLGVVAMEGGKLDGVEACTGVESLDVVTVEVGELTDVETCTGVESLGAVTIEVGELDGVEACAGVDSLKVFTAEVQGVEICAGIDKLVGVEVWAGVGRGVIATGVNELEGVEACDGVDGLGVDVELGVDVASADGLEGTIGVEARDEVAKLELVSTAVGVLCWDVDGLVELRVSAEADDRLVVLDVAAGTGEGVSSAGVDAAGCPPLWLLQSGVGMEIVAGLSPGLMLNVWGLNGGFPALAGACGCACLLCIRDSPSHLDPLLRSAGAASAKARRGEHTNRNAT